MSISSELRAELRAMAGFALPLILTQFAAIGMSVVEIVLAGRLGPHVLGAVAVGTNVWNFAFMGLTGIMLAVSPSVAQLAGARRRGEIGPLFRQALWLGLGAGICAVALVWFVGPLAVAAIGIAPGLAAEADAFLHAACWGAPAVAMYVACRGLSEGLGRPMPSMCVGVLGLVLLVPVGWFLMYVLRLGAFGTGLAMVVTVWAQFGCFLAYIRISPRYRDLGWSRGGWSRGGWRRGRFLPDGQAIRGLLALGGPMAVGMVMENGLFGASALLVGRFGEVAVSGHQIAASVGSVTFMVPLGFAIATTVRVGHAVGRGDAAGVRRAALSGLLLALASQACSAALMLTLPRFIAGLYSGDPSVAGFAAGLLWLAALFQLSDGAQVVGGAALRGLRDARVPMVLTIVAYWVIGMPVGWVLTFPMDWRTPGMWVGLIVGLSAAAVLMWGRFLQLISRRYPVRGGTVRA